MLKVNNNNKLVVSAYVATCLVILPWFGKNEFFFYNCETNLTDFIHAFGHLRPTIEIFDVGSLTFSNFRDKKFQYQSALPDRFTVYSEIISLQLLRKQAQTN